MTKQEQIDKEMYDRWMEQFDKTVEAMRDDFSKQLKTDCEIQDVTYTCKFSVGEPPVMIKQTTRAILGKEIEK